MTFDGESSSSPDGEHPTGASDDEVRAQLERILGHRDFEATQRMRDFLRFVVEETLAGRARRLKGYTIATEVFARGKDFDAARDPIVRIQAGRLRRALERYYLLAGGRDPIRIDIPKGRYAPRFTWQMPSRTRASDGPVGDAQGDDGADGPTVAILPLTTVQTDEEELVFANGLTAELVSELNRYQDVIEVSSQELVAPVAAGVLLRQVSREIGARFLVGGSVRRDASRIKVTVQLTDATTGRQIWGDAYSVDVEAADLIETQEEIACSAIAAIAGEYGIIARCLYGESRSKRLADLSNYEALLRYHHYVLVMTPDAGEAALAALQQAAEREPEYAPAWAGLAHLHCHIVVLDRPGVERPLDVARVYARRAAALDPHSQLARTILAYVYLLRGEMAPFWSEANAALSLNPNSPSFSGSIGFLLVGAGDFERGRRLLERSIALDPRHPKWFHHALYFVRFARGEYEEAYREALQIGFSVGFWDSTLRTAALAKLGREDEAWAAAGEIREKKPDFEARIRDLLSYTCKPADVLEDFLAGLRQAGLRID